MLNISRMQAGGRFIEDIEGFAAAPAGEFLGKLDPLGFTSGERYRGLPKGDIGKANIKKGLEFSFNRRNILEKTPAPPRPSSPEFHGCFYPRYLISRVSLL